MYYSSKIITVVSVIPPLTMFFQYISEFLCKLPCTIQNQCAWINLKVRNRFFFFRYHLREIWRGRRICSNFLYNLEISFSRDDCAQDYFLISKMFWNIFSNFKLKKKDCLVKILEIISQYLVVYWNIWQNLIDFIYSFKT